MNRKGSIDGAAMSQNFWITATDDIAFDSIWTNANWKCAQASL